MSGQESRTRREERFTVVSAEMREHDTPASCLDSQFDEKSLSANQILRLGPFYLRWLGCTKWLIINLTWPRPTPDRAQRRRSSSESPGDRRPPLPFTSGTFKTNSTSIPNPAGGHRETAPKSTVPNSPLICMLWTGTRPEGKASSSNGDPACRGSLALPRISGDPVECRDAKADGPKDRRPKRRVRSLQGAVHRL
jgi:hypothetical protein